VALFTDAVFAIAMTLLVVEVGVPEPVAAAKEDPGALLDLLSDKVPLLIAFFIGCYVIGQHHGGGAVPPRQAAAPVQAGRGRAVPRLTPRAGARRARGPA
jgi:Endosomal/lysosomal potassium channel TMEM175